MTVRFLDTNILVRHLTHDDPEKSVLAKSLLMRVDRGEEQLVTSPMVVFETVFTLQKAYQASRTAIKDGIEAVISLRGPRLATKRLYYTAFNLYVNSNISFADAYNVAFMRSTRLSEIYTWDTDFDKVPGIEWMEPA